MLSCIYFFKKYSCEAAQISLLIQGEIYYVAENWKSSAFPSAKQRPIPAPCFFVTWILKGTGWHKLGGLLFSLWDITHYGGDQHPLLYPVLRDFHKIPIIITSQGSLINFLADSCLLKKGTCARRAEGNFPGELTCTGHFCPLSWEISDSVLCMWTPGILWSLAFAQRSCANAPCPTSTDVNLYSFL